MLFSLIRDAVRDLPSSGGKDKNDTAKDPRSRPTIYRSRTSLLLGLMLLKGQGRRRLNQGSLRLIRVTATLGEHEVTGTVAPRRVALTSLVTQPRDACKAEVLEALGRLTWLPERAGQREKRSFYKRRG
jgi:hypothetical protein